MIKLVWLMLLSSSLSFAEIGVPADTGAVLIISCEQLVNQRDADLDLLILAKNGDKSISVSAIEDSIDDIEIALPTCKTNRQMEEEKLNKEEDKNEPKKEEPAKDSGSDQANPSL